MGGNWTRRQVLRRGGAAAAGVAGLGLAGYAGYAWPHPEATAGTPDSTAGTHPAATGAPSPAAGNTAAVDHFVTRSDIYPPAIKVTRDA
ncbi:MAG: twin-arginine translocation signal domain-containing protein, partial [Streptosporangiaceae bacterium]